MAVPSSNHPKFRELAEAVAKGEGPFVAGRRLGIPVPTVSAWRRYSSFELLVTVLRSDEQCRLAERARAALDADGAAAAPAVLRAAKRNERRARASRK